MTELITTMAHGRVNLIGEHTDYNGGWVLPTSIPQYTKISIKHSPQNQIKVKSSLNREFQYHLGDEKKSNTWIDYIQGATAILGKKLQGFEIVIESSIPEGSGLSSSAALETSLLKALNKLFDLQMDDLTIAKLGQRIENEFVGARVGIMDQMATCLARDDEALFLDTKTLNFERVPLPIDLMELLVINSGISHRLSSHDGGYNQRRSECEEACKILGIPLLRDIELEKIQILSPQLKKRARHVLTENQRVKDSVEAIKQKDLTFLGKLFNESHQSMRDDYEVSIPEIDLLVELCCNNTDVYGARLTGGGFGGSIVAITKKGTKSTIGNEVLKHYHQKTNAKGSILV
jgi:galactokinase